MLLKYSEAKHWREKLVCSKGMSTNTNVNTYLKLYDNLDNTVSQMQPHQILPVNRMGNL
jgi:hypothetical protein